MTATPATFVAMFPEFANSTTYPTVGIQAWLNEAYNQLNAYRFGASLDLAAMLWTAHNIVLGARAAAMAASNGNVGEAAGPVQQKSVGQVSVNYDTQAAALEGAGIYATTSYGQRFWKMAQAFAAGGLYRSPKSIDPPPQVGYSGGRWPFGGPW
ncbi:MAG: DUF4054 domain-containing protein [Bradyrhizobium sp.]